MGTFLTYPTDKPGVIRCRTIQPSSVSKNWTKSVPRFLTKPRKKQAVEDLNSLGLNYRLVTGTAADGNKNAGKKPQETASAGTDKKRAARAPKEYARILAS
jgi:hypothetical protein